jgi:hypothetical protein
VKRRNELRSEEGRGDDDSIRRRAGGERKGNKREEQWICMYGA